MKLLGIVSSLIRTGCFLAGLFTFPILLGAEKEAFDLAPGQVLPVRETFDGNPFTYEVVKIETREHCLVAHLQYPSPVVSDLPQNNVIPVEYYLPKPAGGVGGKRPAVICLHILDGSLELVQMLASVLASRGVPAVVFPLPYYGPRGTADGPYRILANPQRFVSVLEQAFLEVRRAVDFLASRPEVNPQQIGVAGISLGGIIAASAAEREARVHKAGLILAGGNLRQIVETAREAAPLREFIAKLDGEQQAMIWTTLDQVDPLAQAQLLKDRAQQGQVLMINAAEDEVIPRICTEQLAEALGISDRVVWLPDLGHYTAIASLPGILERVTLFFASDLPSELQSPEASSSTTTPLQLISGTVQKLTEFYLREPSANCAHIGQIKVRVDGDQYSLLLIRGSGHRFRLEGRASGFGQFMLGQRDYPWLMAKNGLVFVGEPESSDEPRSPLLFVKNLILERARFAVLAVSGLSASPAALEALIRVKEEPEQTDARTLVVSPADEKSPVRLRIRYSAAADFPNSIRLTGLDQQIQVEIESWQIDTPISGRVFDPPADKPRKNVLRNDLYRMYGAVINFLAEMAP
ncbi:MAG: alpha/beta hydrolase [Thermogutta sp.]